MPVVVLNSQQHLRLCVRPPANFDFLATAHMLPLVVTECGHAGSDYPVAFVHDKESKRFRLVTVLGLREGENLFVDKGKWLGLYMPAVVQIAPFKMVTDPNRPDELVVGLDTDDDRVQEVDGEALFDSDGNETPFLVRVKESLGQYYQNQRYTHEFINVLTELELLVPRDLLVRVDGQETKVSGLFSIDEQKLNDLSDEQFADLRKRGFLAGIYAQMLSLNQVHRLASIKSQA